MNFKVELAERRELGWLCDRSGWPRDSVSAGARGIKVVHGGRVLAMVGYDQWTPAAVQCHVAVDTPSAWLPLLRGPGGGPSFRYPFVECGRDVLVGVVPEDNHRSRRACERLGFRLAHTVEGGFAPGCDLLLYEMRRAECRYLGG